MIKCKGQGLERKHHSSFLGFFNTWAISVPYVHNYACNNHSGIQNITKVKSKERINVQEPQPSVIGAEDAELHPVRLFFLLLSSSEITDLESPNAAFHLQELIKNQKADSEALDSVENLGLTV